MAFSLESSLVIPLCLIVVSSSLLAAQYIDKHSEESAGLEIVSSFYRYNASRLYRQIPVHYQEAATAALETSPARVIQLSMTIQDNLRPLGRLLPGRDALE